MKLLKDVDLENDIKFKKVRSTSVGAKIIDIEADLIQTCWCKIVYDVDYAICTDVPDPLKDFLSGLDDKILHHCAEVFNMEVQNIGEMYRPVLRMTRDGCYFRMPISNSSSLFGIDANGNKQHYNKKEMMELLRIGHCVRFIIKLKKLYLKDHNLTVQYQLIQAEYT